MRWKQRKGEETNRKEKRCRLMRKEKIGKIRRDRSEGNEGERSSELERLKMIIKKKGRRI